MKTRNFKITCAECGSGKVVLSNWHNADEEGMRLRCKDCEAKEDL